MKLAFCHHTSDNSRKAFYPYPILLVSFIDLGFVLPSLYVVPCADLLVENY
jgi:hypothetical protein